MSTQNQVEHQITAQKGDNQKRLDLYAKRREIYLRHLSEGCKVAFPLLLTTPKDNLHVA